MRSEKLTECEAQVMKVIWESEKELSMMEIWKRANAKYNYNYAWAPQTVSSFLERLRRKEFIKYYRVGRLFYYEVLVSYEEYRRQMVKELIGFWFCGSDDETIFDEVKLELQDLRH